jgi:hypothetical protein
MEIREREREMERRHIRVEKIGREDKKGGRGRGKRG